MCSMFCQPPGAQPYRVQDEPPSVPTSRCSVSAGGIPGARVALERQLVCCSRRGVECLPVASLRAEAGGVNVEDRGVAVQVRVGVAIAVPGAAGRTRAVIAGPVPHTDLDT